MRYLLVIAVAACSAPHHLDMANLAAPDLRVLDLAAPDLGHLSCVLDADCGGLAAGHCCGGYCHQWNEAENCGGCGFRCYPLGIKTTCCPTTPTATAYACADPQADNANCGGCGIRCEGSEVCCKGACNDFENDPRNCGSCGYLCQSGQLCKFGTCIKP